MTTAYNNDALNLEFDARVSSVDKPNLGTWPLIDESWTHVFARRAVGRNMGQRKENV